MNLDFSRSERVKEGVGWRMKRIMARRMIEDGCKIPRGYRIAYRDFNTASWILYPIGIHWIVSLFHFLRRISYTFIGPTKVEHALRKSYNDGLEIGRKSERLYWEKNTDSIVKQKVEKKTLDLVDTILKIISDSIKGENNEMEITKDI